MIIGSDSKDLLEIIQLVETFFIASQPSLVMTHFRGDLNIDHRIVNQAVINRGAAQRKF